MNNGIAFDIQTKDKEVINYTHHFENLLKEKGIQISPKTRKSNTSIIIIALLDQLNDELGSEGYLLNVKKD